MPKFLFNDNKFHILQHLNHLLNCRQGSLKHMPDYGLPDYNFQKPRQVYINSIAESIKKYEPRVLAVMISEVNSSKYDCILQLNITIHSSTKTPYQFVSYLYNNGNFIIDYV